MKKIFVLGLCAVMALSTSLALGSKEDEIYRQYITEDPGGLNSLFTQSGTAFDVLYYEGGIVEDLLEQTYWDFGNMTFQPGIIDSWEFKNNDTTVVYHFRDDVLWHDYEKLTAHDMEFTYDVILTPESGSQQFVEDLETWVKDYRALDDCTFEVDLKMADPAHFQSIYFTVGILLIPEHYFEGVPMEKIGFHEEFNNYPVGYGPYKVVERAFNSYVRVERFDGYWREDLPKIDTIVYKVIAERYPRWVAFKNAEIDMIDRSSDYMEEFEKMRAKGQIKAYDYPSRYFNGFRLNFLDPENPLQSKEVRQAIMYALDKELLTEVVNKGTTVPLQTIVTERYPDRINPDTPRYNYDPEKAKELLAEAGYVDTNKDGYLDKDGEKLSLIFPYVGGGSQDDVAEWFRAMMKDVGIETDIQQIDAGTWRELIDGAGTWDILSISMSQGAFVADSIDFWFHTEGMGNSLKYSNEVLDNLLDEWKLTVDPVRQKEIVYEIQNVIADDLPFFYIQQRMDVRAYNKGLSDLVHSPWGMETNVREMYWV